MEKLNFAVAVAGVDIDRMDLSMQLPDSEFITNTSLPGCNRDATNVADVYNVYDIIPESKLETMYEKATEMLNDESSVDGFVPF